MRSRTKRRPDWLSLLAAYAKRTGSREEFCKRHGVKSSTLSYHVTKSAKSPKFVPLIQQLESSPEIVLELPAGVKLTIRR